MGRFIRAVVENETENRVGRGGKSFFPHEKKEVYVTEMKLKEIKACSGLSILEVGEKSASTDISCPICKVFTCENKKGLKKHIRVEHPDDYAKLKISR